jgi:hypothetical protein
MLFVVRIILYPVLTKTILPEHIALILCRFTLALGYAQGVIFVQNIERLSEQYRTISSFKNKREILNVVVHILHFEMLIYEYYL